MGSSPIAKSGNLSPIPISPGLGNDVAEPAVSSAQAEFETIFNERYVLLVRLATAMVDQRSIAEEIVQDSFHQLWQRFDNVETPTAYLRTTVTNGCLQELRRRRVRRKYDRPDRPDGLSEEQHFLLDALLTVSIRKRTALVLRFYGGFSMAEIAEAMGTKTGTAKSLISRGLADLRKVIEK